MPFFPQEENFCGPAALATVVAWSGVAVEPAELVEKVYTPGRNGTLQSDILAAARREGRLAVPVTSLHGLMSEIAAGHPVLVFQNLSLDWYPQWHYAVAFAYDLHTREMTLRSGQEQSHVTSIDNFEHTWRRADYWALVVSSPDDLPASAEMIEVERAAVALERAGRSAQAKTAYSAILERWPGSYAAFLGLGNIAYASGDFDVAKASFESATLERPERPEAWNNLAYALAAQGRLIQAVRGAQQAMKLSKGSDQRYVETLHELSGS